MRQSGVVCAIGDRSADCRWPAASDSRTRAVAREWNSLFGFWLTLLVNDNWTPLPLFFTSGDSKGTLSCLESPLIEVMILKDLGREIGVWKGKLLGSADSKELRERRGERRDGSLIELEGPRGGRAWIGGQARQSFLLNETIITYSCNLSIVNYKCFRGCGIALSDKVGTAPRGLRTGGRGSG
jgi:hypothetical protein